MFLNKLDKKEKELFIKSAAYLVQADGAFSEKEKELFKIYEEEMHEKFDGVLESTYHVEKLVDGLGKINTFSQKIIFFELMALSMCDGISSEENIFLEKVQRRFQISNDKVLLIKECIDEITASNEKIIEVLNNV